jgi:predicted nuclease of restriction endonuclease-like RecB superfamily
MFRSKFEQTFATHLGTIGIEVHYEEEKFPFVVPVKNRMYTPDFKIGPSTYVETKGMLSKDDREKLLLVKSQHPNIRIIMVFQNWNNKIAKNSKTTYKKWCDDNNIECYNKHLPEGFKV